MGRARRFFCADRERLARTERSRERHAVTELPFFTGEEGRGHMLALLFFLAVFLIAVWGSWQGALPASDEAVIAQIANEVPNAARALPLRFDGAPVHDVPPLAPWLMSLMYTRFGTNNFGARFAFILLSIGAVYLTLCAGRAASRTWDPPAAPGASFAEGDPPAAEEERGRARWGSLSAAAGFFSAVVLAASPMFGRFMPHVTLGMPFAFFAALGLLGWLRVPFGVGGAVLWGTAVAGSVLSAGGGGLLLVPGAFAAAAVDRRRRALLRAPGFYVATLAGMLLGGVWLVAETVQGGQGFFAGPLWAPLAIVARPSSRAFASLLDSLKNVWLMNLPWSIPATLAAARVVFFARRNGREGGADGVDASLLVFAAVIFVPLACAGGEALSRFLPVLPFVAVLSAREVARWMRRPGKNLAGRLWTVNHVATAVFCLLMLLIVTTPISVRRTSDDSIESVARMAALLVPAGSRVGNVDQPYREQGARMLFYGGRELEPPRGDARAIAEALREHPETIFLSSARKLEMLRSSGDLAAEIHVMYGAGDLVLFGARSGDAGGPPEPETEAR
jgi:4-amino-4-deoxy-L-arabinose transferase-like glycosyltransferase